MGKTDLAKLIELYESSLVNMQFVESTLMRINKQYPQLFLHSPSCHRIVEESVSQDFLRALDLPWQDSPDGEHECLGIELSKGYVSLTKDSNQVKVIYIPF